MSINVQVTQPENVGVTITTGNSISIGIGGDLHNSLAGLQGGSQAERFHLTEDEVDLIHQNASDINTISGLLSNDLLTDIVFQTGNQTISGLKTFEDNLAVNANINASGDVNIIGDINQTGDSNIVGDISVDGSITTIDSIQFDTTAGVTAVEGQLAWNANENTLDLGLTSNVTLQIGEEQLIKVRADVDIKNGQAVYATGAQGTGSGNIKVNLFSAGNSAGIDELYFLGIATEDISAGQTGYATTFGKVRDVLVGDIRGADDPDYAQNGNVGWDIGTVLYISALSAGRFTSLPPVSPDKRMAVAMVIAKNGQNRILFVRAETGYHLTELHDVYARTPSNADALIYNSASQRWENRLINAGDISGLYDFITGTESEFFTEAEADARYVNLYSGQNISGVKNFYDRPTVNGIGVLLSGEGGGGSVSGDYLPLSGGTITGDLYLQEDPENPEGRSLNVEGTIQGSSIYSPNAISTDTVSVGNQELLFLSPTIGYISWIGQSRIYSSSNGVIKLTNATNNNFNRLQFGGISTSFPSIKRNGSGIDIRDASDIQFAPLAASNITANGSIYATSGIYATGTIIANNDIEVSDFNKGIVLKSPDGNRFRITVNNSGALTTTQL